MTPEALANAFLHAEDRKVGCISFMGKTYELGLARVQRANITEVTIEYAGHMPWKARELVIGERTGKRPALPAGMQPQLAETSQLLRGAEAKHGQRQAH